MAGFFYEAEKQNPLYRKTLATATTPAGIGVIEVKTLPIQTVAELQFRVHEVQKAFQVGYNTDALVFKNLVHRFLLVVKIHFITQSAASPAHHAYAQEIAGVLVYTGIFHQAQHHFPGFVTDEYRIIGSCHGC